MHQCWVFTEPPFVASLILGLFSLSFFFFFFFFLFLLGAGSVTFDTQVQASQWRLLLELFQMNLEGLVL